MKQYNDDIQKAIQLLVNQILKGNLTKREIEKLLTKFRKKLKIPTKQFKQRMEAEARLNALLGRDQTLSLLMGLNKEATLTTLTATDIQKIASVVMGNDFAFAKWKNKNRNSLIFEQYNMSKVIDDLENLIVNDVRKRMMGGLIAGATPARIASQLLDRNASKKIRRNIKTVYKTVKYRSQSLANVETFTKNEKYYDWIKWHTVGDDRVDEICVHLEKESTKIKVKASKLPPYMIPPSHFNCRCTLKPMVDPLVHTQHVNNL